jgi:hypothetical protein
MPRVLKRNNIETKIYRMYVYRCTACSGNFYEYS